MSNVKSAYGVGAAGINVMPLPIVSQRDPVTSDIGYPIGQQWVNESSNVWFVLTSVVANSATWASATSTGAIMTLTGDAGGAISPVLGDIILAGTAAQGISTSGAGNTITFTVEDAGTAQKGVAETATDGEAQAKASTAVVLTPSNLAALGASTSLAGLVELATDAEAQAQSSTTTAITPSNLVALKAGTNISFYASPALQSSATTGAAPTGTTGATNIMVLQDGIIMEQFILGAGQTIIAPRMLGSGLSVGLDLTATEGAEYNFGILSNNKHVYTIGTSPAFYIQLVVKCLDVSGLEPLVVGFRKQEANNATLSNYTDYATIGLNNSVASAVAIIETQLNAGGTVQTNTTDAWTDSQTKTVRVNVSAAGVVTYLINGVAPTVTAAYTFDNGDVVMPFIRHTYGATSPSSVFWDTLKVGLQ